MLIYKNTPEIFIIKKRNNTDFKGSTLAAQLFFGGVIEGVQFLFDVRIR